ncbi:MAG: ABC transporter substrate-binding protein [Clostridiales bacterium]|nr:ABC transporter substrate-binding protein [Clostridiales bacterium]
MKKLSFLVAMILLLAFIPGVMLAVDASKLEPYEIVWYTLGTEREGQQAVIDKINEYLTEKFNATLKMYVNTNSDHLQKLQLLISAREKFDICFVSGQYASYVSQEAFYPLRELLKEYGPALMETFPQNLWDSVTINGEIYAVPVHKYSCSHYYFIINMDAAKKAGVDTDWNTADVSKMDRWNAFINYLLEMEKVGADTKGFITSMGSQPFTALFPNEAMTGNSNDPGFVILGDDTFTGYERNQVFNQFATPEFEGYVRDAYKLAQAGALPLDPETIAKLDQHDPVVSVQDSMAKRLSGYEVTYGADFEPYFISYAFQTTDKIYGSMNAISDTSDDPARAMMFLNALIEDRDFANLVFYGIEGVNWNRNADGQIEMTDPKTYAMTTWALPGFLTAEPDISLPIDMVDRYNAFAKELVPADNLGFALDEEPIMIELAAIRQVVAEYLEPLTKGLANPDTELPKFIDGLQSAGVDTAIAEMQKQLDAWRVAQGYDK